MFRLCLLISAVCLAPVLIAQDVALGPKVLPSSDRTSVDDWLEENMESLGALYRHLHSHPEISFQEEATAARLADEWESFGFDVTRNVGGFGIVGILENGPGKTLMLRTDLDALPLQETTWLPYASKVQTVDDAGQQTFVMHACGHDIHMTNVTAVAKYLAEHRKAWTGTLMVIGQPAEEVGGGAIAMLKDGLFTRFEKPDFAIALHVSADMPVGSIGYRPGYSQANVDSVDITMKGRGGHGSKPETTIDPIMQAAELVVALQTIVSREVAPTDPAVVTVGSIHGGTKHNIIPNECKLQLTVRSYSPQVRSLLLSAIERKANAVAKGSRAPKPDVTTKEGTPSLFNDEELAARLAVVFRDVVGPNKVLDLPPSMGGEDFSRYGLAGVPIMMYSLGTVSVERLKKFAGAKRPPPSLHSSQYYPDYEPALRTGIATMTAAALELLSK